MSEVAELQYGEESVEHEGKKTPIKTYEWDEIEDIDVDEPFDVDSIPEAKRAHTLLHLAWDDSALPGWHYDQIIAEHARIVQFLLDKGHRHKRVDSLDTTLPEDLKEKSIRPEKDISYIRTVNYYIKQELEMAGIDTVKKLADADIEELAEETSFDEDYLEYIQERAEDM